jgi:hypothetical protein
VRVPRLACLPQGISKADRVKLSALKPACALPPRPGAPRLEAPRPPRNPCPSRDAPFSGVPPPRHESQQRERLAAIREEQAALEARQAALREAATDLERRAGVSVSWGHNNRSAALWRACSMPRWHARGRRATTINPVHAAAGRRSKLLGAAAERLASLREQLREADDREEGEARRALHQLREVRGSQRICGLAARHAVGVADSSAHVQQPASHPLHTAHSTRRAPQEGQRDEELRRLLGRLAAAARPGSAGSIPSRDGDGAGGSGPESLPAAGGGDLDSPRSSGDLDLADLEADLLLEARRLIGEARGRDGGAGAGAGGGAGAADGGGSGGRAAVGGGGGRAAASGGGGGGAGGARLEASEDLGALLAEADYGIAAAVSALGAPPAAARAANRLHAAGGLRASGGTLDASSADPRRPRRGRGPGLAAGQAQAHAASPRQAQHSALSAGRALQRAGLSPLREASALPTRVRAARGWPHMTSAASWVLGQRRAAWPAH